VIHTKEKKNSITWTGRLKSTCCMHACNAWLHHASIQNY
jgi:hypothetical protein